MAERKMITSGKVSLVWSFALGSALNIKLFQTDLGLENRCEFEYKGENFNRFSKAAHVLLKSMLSVLNYQIVSAKKVIKTFLSLSIFPACVFLAKLVFSP